MKHPGSIYYAMSPSPKYVHLARASIESVRRHNATIPIYVALGGPGDEDTAPLRALGAELVQLPLDPKGRLTWNKWFALRHVPEGNLLFLDPDTHCFRDPAEIMRSHEQHDFAAREEMGTQRDGRRYIVGNRIAYPQIDWQVMHQLRNATGGADMPIFNTGVMYISEAARDALIDGVAVMDELHTLWSEARVPYPSTNGYILEELAASMMLGCIPDLCWGFIDPSASPFYVEWKGRVVSDPGIVMHVWNHFVQFFVADFHGDEAARAYEELDRKAPVVRG